MLLLLAPPLAAAQADDPVAHACYFCTAPEMQQVAVGLGEGTHYVYDFDALSIDGYTVSAASGQRVATRFEAEDWVKRQFLSLAEHYMPSAGVVKYFERVRLYAPGSDHGMRTLEEQYILGHHLSALHPRHAQARETVVRYLQRHGNFGFLDTRDSGGRLLQLQVMRERGYPVMALLALNDGNGNSARFHFDYLHRQWAFADATEPGQSGSVQNTAEDFLPGQVASMSYHFSWLNRWFADAFVDRARWAGIEVLGEAPTQTGNVTVLCQRLESGAVGCRYQ
ncbi:hypothetical protein [Stenotrophomonas sp.]|uniref:hypothetical protein n=1 Tax=Stenotrophomonas sp. TaxID=69392 RepID=UPI002FC92425